MKKRETPNIVEIPPGPRHPRRRFKARYRDKKGHTRSKTFPNKESARRFLDRVSADKQRGELLDLAKANQRFRIVADAWDRTLDRNRKKKTTQGYRDALKGHVRPRWDEERVGEIDFSAVDQWIQEMIEEGRSASTIRARYKILRLVMGYAVVHGYIRANPCRDIPLPSPSNEEMLFLTAGEVRALANAVAAPHGIVVLFAAYTGLRQGEIAALRISDVNWLKGTVFVSKTLSDINGTFDETTPKSKAALRTVGIPAFVMDELRAYVGDKPAPNRYLFTAERGGPIRFNNWRRRYFRPAVLRSLPEDKHALRFHDLRHTHAALLVEQGWHPKAMAERLGHAKVQITLDRYAHVMPHLNEALTERLDAAYRDVKAAEPQAVRRLR